MNDPYPGHWGRSVLDHTDWTATLSAYGDGQKTAELLRGDLNAPALLQHLCSAVVHQETLFPVAEPTVRFLLPFALQGLELKAFWTEWLAGIDLVSAEYAVSDDMVTKAISTVQQTRALEGEDGLGFLFEDLEKGSPASVLTNYTYQQGALIRPFVVRLLNESNA